MLSIPGWIGHLLRYLDFFFYIYIDKLDVIYTGPDRSFIVPSGPFFFFLI